MTGGNNNVALHLAVLHHAGLDPVRLVPCLGTCLSVSVSGRDPDNAAVHCTGVQFVQDSCTATQDTSTVCVWWWNSAGVTCSWWDNNNTVP